VASTIFLLKRTIASDFEEYCFKTSGSFKKSVSKPTQTKLSDFHRFSSFAVNSLMANSCCYGAGLSSRLIFFYFCDYNKSGFLILGECGKYDVRQTTNITNIPLKSARKKCIDGNSVV
jgi:hypothetical protein